MTDCWGPQIVAVSFVGGRLAQSVSLSSANSTWNFLPNLFQTFFLHEGDMSSSVMKNFCTFHIPALCCVGEFWDRRKWEV